jgi:hypothetical protein
VRYLSHLNTEAKIEMRLLSHLKIKSKGDEIFISIQYRGENEMGLLSHLK